MVIKESSIVHKQMNTMKTLLIALLISIISTIIVGFLYIYFRDLDPVTGCCNICDGNNNDDDESKKDIQ
jgi:ABC-type polysaccharide/polyol phosphate export permease